MGEHAKALGGEAAVEIVEANGKTFELYPITQRVKAAYERWLECRVEEKLEERRASLGEERYADERDRIADRIDSGGYSWGTRVCQLSLRKDAGALYFTYLLTCKGKPDRDPDILAGLLDELWDAVNANQEGFTAAINRVREASPNLTAPGRPGTV